MKIYYQNPENSMKYFSGFTKQFWMKFDNKISWKSMKLKPNLHPNLTPFYGQIHRKSAIFNQFMYYPLLKIHRKSAIFDNKFIENQWNLNQILAKIELKLTQIQIKL